MSHASGREVASAAEEAALAPATAGKTVSKKRKLEITADASSAVAEGPLQEAAKAQLEGHSQCVSGVAWPDQDTIYTGSWDHSVSALSLSTKAQRHMLQCRLPRNLHSLNLCHAIRGSANAKTCTCGVPVKHAAALAGLNGPGQL